MDLIQKELLEACLLYTSQPVHLIAVQSEEGLAKISKAAGIYGAPLAIIVCADHNKAWVRPFDQKQTNDIDASILTDHMMLQATELGLGTVWVCYFKPDVLREEFKDVYKRQRKGRIDYAGYYQDRIFENKTIPYHLGWCGADVTFGITYLVHFYGK